LGGKRGRLVTERERISALTLIKEAVLSGARRSKCCAILDISLRTLQRWEKPDGVCDSRVFSQRNTIKNKLTLKEKDMILEIANSAKFRDLSPCKIVPLLADEGRYIASESTFYRVLKDAKQLTHRHKSAPQKHHKPESFTAIKPNQVWSWDITYLPSQIKGQYFYLYLIMDIFSRKIVGWSVHEQESSNLASALMTQTCLDEKIDRGQIVLHSDNGSPMKGLTMLATLEKLGVMPSFSRPSVSDDNPFSESLFKTLKYHPTFPRMTCFESIAEARVWCAQFEEWYNHKHLHSALKFVTPHQRHTGADEAILKKRHAVYQMAKMQRPDRWSGKTKNWELDDMVALNHDKKRILNTGDICLKNRAA
jgi:transposase InsO family protein